MATYKTQSQNQRITKEDFLDYLEKYAEAVCIFDEHLSFAGSDGPKIKEWGFKDGAKYNFSSTKEIDEYILDGCKYAYGGPHKKPKKSFTEYIKEKYGL